MLGEPDCMHIFSNGAVEPLTTSINRPIIVHLFVNQLANNSRDTYYITNQSSVFVGLNLKMITIMIICRPLVPACVRSRSDGDGR